MSFVLSCFIDGCFPVFVFVFSLLVLFPFFSFRLSFLVPSFFLILLLLLLPLLLLPPNTNKQN